MKARSAGTPRGRLGVTWRLPCFNIATRFPASVAKFAQDVRALLRVFLQAFLAWASLALAALPMVRKR
jgi:hypothetical protein